MSLGRTPVDDKTRDAMRQWLDNWARVGPLLERERWDRLATMTEEEARRATEHALDLWQPGWSTDDGEGLLLQQRVFARARANR